MKSTTSEAVKRKPWRRHNTVASIFVLVGVFAASLAGASAESTLSRLEDKELEVRQLEVAADVSYMLTEAGELYSQGLNNFGQLGVNSLVNNPNWARVKFVSEGEEPTIEKISTQGEHVLALDKAGELWAWGSNDNAALGSTPANPRLRPAKVSVAYSFKELQAGDDFAVAIDSRGSLYTWGRNSSNQLGRPTEASTAGPSIINPEVKYSTVTAGKDFALALDTNGGLWAWGSNQAGQYGNGGKEASVTPVAVEGGPWKTVTASKFSNTVAAIDKAGKLWTWGAGDHALLGVGADWRADQVTENKRVADEIAAIKAKDQTDRANLVKKLSEERLTELQKDWLIKKTAWDFANPEPLASDFPVTANQDNKKYTEAKEAWTAKKSEWLKANPELLTIEELSAEDKLAIETKVSEEWKETDVSGLVPAVIPEPEIPVESLSPIQVAAGSTFTKVSLGSENAFALDNLGRLWAWGNDQNGQTGLGLDEGTHTHRPVKVSEAGYSDVFAGDKWATTAGGGLFSWGLNNNFNTLQSSSDKLLSPTRFHNGVFKRVTGGGFTGAAMKADGTTSTWGSNIVGLAGRASDQNNLPLDQIEGAFNQLAFSNKGVLALSKENNNLYFWGSDDDRISANSSEIKEVTSSPKKHSIEKFNDVATGRLSSHVVDFNGFVWTWGINWLEANGGPATPVYSPTQVAVGANVKKIAATQTAVLILTDTNELRWWGAASKSAITSMPLGDASPGAIVELKSGKDHFLLRDEAGAVYSFLTAAGAAGFEGQNVKELFKIETPEPASFIAAGDDASVVVAGNKTYGWGSSLNQQLTPDPAVTYSNVLVELPNPYSDVWSHLAISATHTLGVSKAGVLYGWGHSSYIQGLNTLKPTKPTQLAVVLESE